jgi:hypothetical protein
MTFRPRLHLSGAAAERGAALLFAVAATLMLTTIGVGLILATMTESMIAGGYQSGHEAFYAADAGLEWAVWELGRREDWTGLPGTVRPAVFTGTPSVARPPVEVAAATATLQRSSDAVHGTGLQRRLWYLLGSGWLSGLTGVDGSPWYVVVWIADDPAEADGQPGLDTTRRLLVHVEAYGPREARRSVEGLVAPGARLLVWVEPRDGT